MSEICFRHEKQFCFFLLFCQHSCQAFAWDSAQTYNCNTNSDQVSKAENPPDWFSELGNIWAIPKFPAVQAGGHAQQCQSSALGARQPLQLTSSQIPTQPTCPKPHCKHNARALNE